MSLLQDRKEFLKRQAQAIVNTPKPSASHTTYVPVANKQASKRKRAADSTIPQTEAEMVKQKAKTASFANSIDDSVKVNKMDAVNFSTLAQIVDFMKKRHLHQNPWPLTLNEILEEMQLDSLSTKTVNWLSQALPSNPRLIAQLEGETVKFAYKPLFKIKNKPGLVALFKKYHTDGKGAILLSELNDSIPNAAKIVESLGPLIIDVATQVNKRKDRAFFYNDTETDYTVEDQFVSLWRNVNVDHMDDNKIAEYLQKHGITSVKDLAPHRTTGVPKRKVGRRRANTRVQNTHIEGVLQDFDINN